jgi:hypothetical protein
MEPSGLGQFRQDRENGIKSLVTACCAPIKYFYRLPLISLQAPMELCIDEVTV